MPPECGTHDPCLSNEGFSLLLAPPILAHVPPFQTPVKQKLAQGMRSWAGALRRLQPWTGSPGTSAPHTTRPGRRADIKASSKLVPKDACAILATRFARMPCDGPCMHADWSESGQLREATATAKLTINARAHLSPQRDPVDLQAGVWYPCTPWSGLRCACVLLCEHACTW